MQELFWLAAEPLISDGAPSAVMLAGMPVCGIDGMLVSVADSPANRGVRVLGHQAPARRGGRAAPAAEGGNRDSARGPCHPGRDQLAGPGRGTGATGPPSSAGAVSRAGVLLDLGTSRSPRPIAIPPECLETRPGTTGQAEPCRPHPRHPSTFAHQPVTRRGDHLRPRSASSRCRLERDRLRSPVPATVTRCCSIARGSIRAGWDLH
jgi:hypothetical protein